MPSEADLPRGTVRDFVELLFWIYQKAHRPALREISAQIRRDDLRGTASTETIRRMLNGTTVPARWEIVEAVYLVLCDLAGRSPKDEINWGNHVASIETHIDNAWHEALNYPDKQYYMAAYSDEPPF